MEALWLLAVGGGPLILGLILAIMLIRRHRLNAAERAAQKRQTEALYHDEIQ